MLHSLAKARGSRLSVGEVAKQQLNQMDRLLKLYHPVCCFCTGSRRGAHKGTFLVTIPRVIVQGFMFWGDGIATVHGPAGFDWENYAKLPTFFACNLNQ